MERGEMLQTGKTQIVFNGIVQNNRDHDQSMLTLVPATLIAMIVIVELRVRFRACRIAGSGLGICSRRYG